MSTKIADKDIVESVLKVSSLISEINRIESGLRVDKLDNLEKLDKDIALCKMEIIDVSLFQSVKIEGNLKKEDLVKLAEVLNETRSKLEKFYDNQIEQIKNRRHEVKTKMEEEGLAVVHETAEFVVKNILF